MNRKIIIIEPNRGLILLLIILFLITIGIETYFLYQKYNLSFDYSRTDTTTIETVAETSAETTMETILEDNYIDESDPIIKYRIIHTIQNYKVSGESKYYLQTVTSIDLSNDDFKSGLKGIIKRFVKQHENKVTLKIFDNINALEKNYEFDENFNNTLVNNEDYLREQEIHYVAL